MVGWLAGWLAVREWRGWWGSEASFRVEAVGGKAWRPGVRREGGGQPGVPRLAVQRQATGAQAGEALVPTNPRLPQATGLGWETW